MNKNIKVIVIGLDGATLNLINPWAEEGALPNFKKFIKKGAFGNLKSTLPILSPPAWTSIVTGKNPGKHGIYEFWKWPNKEDPKLHLVTCKDRKSPAIWNILTEYGLKSIVINVPVTYPPEKINGIMVSGMLTPNIKSNFTYPKEIKNMLLERGYEIETNLQELSDNRLKTFWKICKTTQKRAEAAMFLIKNYPWSYFMLVFRELDIVQHYFWDKKKLILKYYKILDDIIGKFFDLIDLNTIIIIVSDHGFGPINKVVNINTWLNKLGILQINKTLYNESVLKRLLYIENKILKIFNKLNIRKFINLIPMNFKKRIPYSTSIENTINFSQTKAYCLSFNGQYLKINNENKLFKNNEFTNYLIHNLYELKDPENDIKIVERIIKKDNIYWGVYKNIAPDLLIKTLKGYAFSPTLGKNNIIEIPSKNDIIRYGDHEINGIFMAYGKGIINVKIKNAFVWDIIPTILNIMGLSTLNDMDGKILKEIFKT